MPQIPPMPNFNPNIQMNPMNQLYGMNPGLNPYSNIPPYGNMMQMPLYNNPNNRNQFNINNNNNNNNNKKNQKKNYVNKTPENMEFPNQMNMYPDQRFGQLYPQVNPMMNMGLGPLSPTTKYEYGNE